jgi:hypothetical protein
MAAGSNAGVSGEPQTPCSMQAVDHLHRPVKLCCTMPLRKKRLTPMSKPGYGPEDYDKNLCLRVDLGMWLTVIFLMRPYVIMILSFANRRAPMELIDWFFPHRTTMALAALASLPVMLFVYGWVRRNPDATARQRQFWRRGRLLLGLSSALNILLLPIPSVFVGNFDWNPAFWIQIVVSAGILVYVWRSRRVIDTLADYPVARKT